MSELLPCPFCGSEADGPDKEVSLYRNSVTGWFVWCDVCGAETSHHLAKETTIAHWNTRTQAPEAIRAAALEEAAKVAETRFKNSAPAYGEVIAAAIRALDPTMAGFSIHPFTGSTE